MQNAKKDLKILKQQGNYEKQTYHKRKASKPEHIKDLNRKAQNNN